MLKKMGITGLIIFVAWTVTPSVGFAQETEEEQAMEEMDQIGEYTFGEIARISKDQITIVEYDFDQEEEVEIDYDVNEMTEYLNIETLSELRVGDPIEIEFKEEGEKRFITAIAKDEEAAADMDFQLMEDDEILEETEEEIEG